MSPTLARGRASAVVDPLKTAPAAALSPAQAAYALALANYAAASVAAEEAKIAAGIDYTTCETDEAIDEMSEREGAINDAHGISALRDALTDAELALVAWGIGRACELAALNEIPVLRDLEKRAVANVVARAKVVALCLKLAA